MFLEIPDILGPTEVERLRALAAEAPFADGRITSPHSKVKNNLQIDHTDRRYEESSKIMGAALQRSETFRNFAFPRRLAPPMLAKYRPGMNYGIHSDAAFIPIGVNPLRSDVSCTLFLTDPQTYDGGELVVHLGSTKAQFKGAAGSIVLYPSHYLHEVAPVRNGERLVGLTFIESSIPDPSHRELLFHLDEVGALEGYNMSWENRTRLQFVRNNLRRMWGEAE